MGAKSGGDHLTPMRRQYLALKQRHPDAILFFRLGDFYETFDADAELVSRVLRITLTSREVGKGQRVPLAGVPYHSVESYLARLVAAGHRVAIAEQMEATPRVGSAGRFARPATSGRDMMAREVVRLITPGTVVEPRMLEASRNNYLCALAAAYGPSGAPQYGLAYADVSTGEFAVAELTGEEAVSELARELERLQPSECIIPGDRRFVVSASVPADDESLEARAAAGRHTSPFEPWRFELTTAQEALCRQFKVNSLSGFGCAEKPLAIRAAGGLIAYLDETNQPLLALLDGMRTYEPGAFMRLDGFTRRNLELVEGPPLRRTDATAPRPTLVSVLDDTQTSMGGRLLRHWLGQPLLEIAALRARHDVVEALADDGVLRGQIRNALQRVADVERLTNRIRQGSAFPRELLALRTSLAAAADVRALGAQVEPGELRTLLEGIDPCTAVADLIARAVYEPGEAESRRASLGTWEEERLIKPGYSVELDDLIRSSADARNWIAGLETAERERTGIKGLKVGFNKVFGYYLHVSHAYKGEVPAHYIRRQTLTDGERYITPELKEYENLVLHAQERVGDLERQLFADLQRTIAQHAATLLATASALARLDVLAGFAEVALRRGFTRPILAEDTTLEIRQGRHPVVEAALDTAVTQVGQPAAFVPNDCRLSTDDEQIVILTGPNMAGKSTYLRSVALVVLLAQAGAFVPAEHARIGLVDRIFTRVGAQDDLAAGQSTFMVEMLETASILRHATERSLVILDEIGRGTSTYDGVAIAQSVVEYLHDFSAHHSSRVTQHSSGGPRTLFATHYHELAELQHALPRVRNFRMDVLEDGEQVVFLHRVVPGSADRSYGIHVARLAGVPRMVTQRAAAVLHDLERQRARVASRPDRGEPPQTILDLGDAGPVPVDDAAPPAPSSSEEHPWAPPANGAVDRSGNGHALARVSGAIPIEAGPGVSRAVQLALFVPTHPLLDELKALDVMNMTPLEALNRLADLSKRARDA